LRGGAAGLALRAPPGPLAAGRALARTAGACRRRLNGELRLLAPRQR